MTNIRDLKLNIIDVLMQTDDLQTLVATYQTLLTVKKENKNVTLKEGVTENKLSEENF